MWVRASKSVLRIRKRERPAPRGTGLFNSPKVGRKDQACSGATRCERRMPAPSMPKPTTIMPHIAGSGTDAASDQLLVGPKSESQVPIVPVHQKELGPVLV